MKKIIQKLANFEYIYCNICEKEITSDPFNKLRIEIVRGLFSTLNFDAHEICINKIIREAFSKFIKNEK